MLKVLVIDDTKSVHAFVKNMFQKSNHIIMTSVFNGQEALQLLKSGERFDLIFLDWEMPVLDGPSTFAKFNQQGIKIPTIMMTTKNSFEDISQMLNMGVSEYLMKPFTIDILFEKINNVTGKDLVYAA
jgi:two-component system chemotaxis response regulator CheY